MTPLESPAFTDYDYLDFGASLGGSMEFAQAAWGPARGLGLDFDPAKVEKARTTGHACEVVNVVQAELPENCVRFVVVNHLLEHLRNPDEVRRVVLNATRAAREFVFIRGPWFDADPYLARMELTFYWSAWDHHRCHVTAMMLNGILNNLPVPNRRFYGHDPIATSAHYAIHPSGAPHNQHHYRPRFGYKPTVTFSAPLFRELVCLVYLTPDESAGQALLSHIPCQPLDDAFGPDWPTTGLYPAGVCMQDQTACIAAIKCELTDYPLRTWLRRNLQLDVLAYYRGRLKSWLRRCGVLPPQTGQTAKEDAP